MILCFNSRMFSIRICKLVIPYLCYSPYKYVPLANPLVLIKLYYISCMQDGYKEREDRIAELEEFINDQVTELDKMEAAMKKWKDYQAAKIQMVSILCLFEQVTLAKSNK